jgi:arginase
MKLHALLVPMDSGHRGWRMGAGPERLLEAGVLDGVREHGVNVSVERYEPESPDGEVGSAMRIASWLSARIVAARRAGAFPLVLSGNCASSLGSVAGLTASDGHAPAVCWFDAHADFNTPETTESGFLDGMALAALTGRCWTSVTRRIPGFQAVPESQVLLLGSRDLDEAEEEVITTSAVRRVGAGDEPRIASDQLRLLKHGISFDTTRASQPPLYLHVDLDALDPSEGTVNVYSCAGGFTRKRLVELVGEIGRTFDVAALALTAYDPKFDREGRIPPIARATIDAVAFGGRDS